MRLELDAISREHETRSVSADREDLLTRAYEALRSSRVLGIDEFVVAAATRAGTLLNHTGRPEDARLILEDTEPLPAGLKDHPLAVSFGQQHARALAALARQETDARRRAVLWEEVEQRTSVLIDLVEEFRGHVSVPDLHNAYARFSIEVYALAVEARIARGDPEGALQRIELVKCRSMHRMYGRKESVSSSAGLRQQFRDTSRQIDEVRKNGGLPSNDLIARRRAIWDLLAIDRFPERGDRFVEFSVAVLQSRLPVATAAVSWFWLDRVRLVVAAISARALAVSIQLVGEPLRQAIDDRAVRILSFVDGNSTNVTRLPAGLTEVLFPAAARDVVETASRLVLSPHRSLHALPLHALPWAGREPLIRHSSVCYAPNLTTLLPEQSARSGGKVLMVGVPRRANLDARPIDGAERERSRMRELYGAETLTERMGSEASEAELAGLNERGQLAEFRALHFACHGMNVDSDNPMESRLLLYDSELDGLDITDWRLDAEIVVLSACSAGQRPVSGRGLKELPGDELFGLQAAFFAAGARQVLATQWPVGDDIAPIISTGFHDHWRSHPADVALKMAICDFLDFYGKVVERTPHLWACFFLTVARMPSKCESEEGGDGCKQQPR